MIDWESCFRFALSNADSRRLRAGTARYIIQPKLFNVPKSFTSQLDERRYQTSLQTYQNHALPPSPPKNTILAAPSKRVTQEQSTNCVSNMARWLHEGFHHIVTRVALAQRKPPPSSNQTKNIPDEDFMPEFWGKVIGCIKACQDASSSGADVVGVDWRVWEKESDHCPHREFRR